MHHENPEKKSELHDFLPENKKDVHPRISQEVDKFSDEITNLLRTGNFPIEKLQTSPVKNFETVSEDIRKRMAEKYNISETEIEVEDVHKIPDLLTEVLYHYNIDEAIDPEDPIPLHQMVHENWPKKLIRVRIKNQPDLWCTISQFMNGNWKIETYPGEIFENRVQAQLPLLGLEDPECMTLLTRHGIKAPTHFIQALKNWAQTKMKFERELKLVQSKQGIMLRVSGSEPDAYEWFFVSPFFGEKK